MKFVANKLRLPLHIFMDYHQVTFAPPTVFPIPCMYCLATVSTSNEFSSHEELLSHVQIHQHQPCSKKRGPKQQSISYVMQRVQEAAQLSSDHHRGLHLLTIHYKCQLCQDPEKMMPPFSAEMIGDGIWLEETNQFMAEIDTEQNSEYIASFAKTYNRRQNQFATMNRKRHLIMYYKLVNIIQMLGNVIENKALAQSSIPCSLLQQKVITHSRIDQGDLVSIRNRATIIRFQHDIKTGQLQNSVRGCTFCLDLTPYFQEFSQFDYFSSIAALKEHIARFHHKCEICQQTLATERMLLTHYFVAHGSQTEANKVKMNQLGKITVSQDAKQLLQTIQDQSLSNELSTDQHEYTEQRQKCKMLPCPLCGIKFWDVELFCNHVRECAK